jgi:hypothetical protein
MQAANSPSAAEAPSRAGDGACVREARLELEDSSRDCEGNARIRAPGDPKPSTSGSMTDIERVEERISDRFDSLARLLEEQNGLLRALVEKADVGPDRGERNEGREGREGREHDGPSTERASTIAPRNIDGRPASRLQRMGKASASREEDQDIERSKARSENNTSRTNHGRQLQMSLAQRKRDFAMKTAPAVGPEARDEKTPGVPGRAGEPGDRRGQPRRSRHSRTRLAVAAARREMERGEAQRALDRVVAREQANSVGAWILFGVLAVLGAVALAFGVFAFRRSKKELYQATRGEL